MSSRVYVGGLSYRAREKDVEHFFRRCGRIRDISLKNGFAFVDFDDPRDAEDAVYDLNGKSIIGDRVSVEIARGTPHGRDRDRWGSGGGGGGRDRSPRRGGGGGGGRDRGGSGGRQPAWMDRYGPPTRTDYRLIVENLSSRVSWQDLKDYMRQAGDVSYANAHHSRRGEGVVEFAHRDDMKTALEKLDGTEFSGKRIRLSEPTARRSRRGSHSRSPSRSRSRSRSRTPRKARAASRSRSRDRENGYKRGGSHSRSRSPMDDGGRRRRHSSVDRDAGGDHRRMDHDDDANGGGRGRSRSRTPRSRSPSPRNGGRRSDDD